MWAFFIFLFIAYVFIRLAWVLIKPICDYIYGGVINAIKSIGVSEAGAKALVSAIIIIILIITMGSC